MEEPDCYIRIMPSHRQAVTRGSLALGLGLAACAPSSFVWDGAATSLEQYRQAFVQTAGTHFVDAVPHDELLSRIAAAKVLWLGDHHRSSRLHALQSKLLHDLQHQLQRRGRAMVLALEAIGQQDAPVVQRYLDGAMSMEDLRGELLARWPGSWLDDGELDTWHYRGLLAFAQRYDVPVVTLEPTPRLSLAARDDVLASGVRSAIAAHPNRLVVVHVGQAHLLGHGDLIARVACPFVAIGGGPTPTLQVASRRSASRASLWQSDAGLWWFSDLLTEQP